MLAFVVALALANAAVGEEMAASQLVEFLKAHPEPEGILTTSWGKPVTLEEASDGLNINKSLIMEHYLFESMSSFTRERLAPRAVHPNGAGAHGYFEVTHDVSHITNVNHFNTVGKKTPIFMRFSPTTGEIGSPELRERNKGIAIKFYTEEGNMDIAAFNINAFAIKDPVYSNVFIHVLKPNPKTRLRDPTMNWDFITKLPAGLHASIMPLAPGGAPRSYGSMPGHALHTYQVENSTGHVNFIKINWFPDEGIQNLTVAEIQQLQGSSPKYHTQELYNRIGKGNFPKYTLCFQVIPFDKMKDVKFDIFDITMNWPEKDFPNYPVGKLVLNKNPVNYQAEVEMAAFNPGNLVPGIQGCDKIMEARTFIYREGHLNRMGSGFNRIPINCPMNKVLTYNRDGAAPVGDNGGDAPNYYPNSFNGPVPVNKKFAPRYRPNTTGAATNFWQVKAFVNDMSAADQDIWYTNIATILNKILPQVQKNVMKLWREVDEKIAERIEETMKKLQTPSG